MLGRRSEQDILGADPGVWLPRADPASIDSLHAMIRASFQIASSESSRSDSKGKVRWLLNSVSGVVDSGALIRYGASCATSPTARRRRRPSGGRNTLPRDIPPFRSLPLGGRHVEAAYRSLRAS